MGAVPPGSHISPVHRANLMLYGDLECLGHRAQGSGLRVFLGTLRFLLVRKP